MYTSTSQHTLVSTCITAPNRHTCANVLPSLETFTDSCTIAVQFQANIYYIITKQSMSLRTHKKMGSCFVVGNECGHFRINGVTKSIKHREVSRWISLGCSWKLSSTDRKGATEEQWNTAQTQYKLLQSLATVPICNTGKTTASKLQNSL